MADNFDPAAPFGGYGESGNGRDKGEAGLEAWTETKVSRKGACFSLCFSALTIEISFL